MKKFIFGLMLFFSGCVIFGSLLIALAIDGLTQDMITAIWFSGLTLPFLFSLTLMVYGVIIIEKEISKKENISSPGEQRDKDSD